MNKSIFISCLIMCFYFTLSAQNQNTSRVVFTVNMQQQEVSPEGVFIVGDFFNGIDLEMDDLGDGTYEYVILLTKGESLFYNFKNGLDQIEDLSLDRNCMATDDLGRRLLVVSEVDTLRVPTVCYSFCENCEAINSNTSRVKITVDMSGQEVPNDGMFVRGVSDAETISGTCLSSEIVNTRMLVVPDSDPFIPPTVCFGSCGSCQLTSTFDLIKEQQIQLSPNITTSETQLTWSADASSKYNIRLFNSQGQLLRQYFNVEQSPFLLEDLPLQAGLYLISIQDENKNSGTLKLMIK